MIAYVVAGFEGTDAPMGRVFSTAAMWVYTTGHLLPLRGAAAGTKTGIESSHRLSVS